MVDINVCGIVMLH